MLANLPAVNAAASSAESTNSTADQGVSGGGSGLPGFGGVLFALLNSRSTGQNAELPLAELAAGGENPVEIDLGDGNPLPVVLPLSVLSPGQPVDPSLMGARVEVSGQSATGATSLNPAALPGVALHARFALGLESPDANFTRIETPLVAPRIPELDAGQFMARPVAPWLLQTAVADTESGLLGNGQSNLVPTGDSLSASLATPGTGFTTLNSHAASLLAGASGPGASSAAPSPTPVAVPLQHANWGQDVADRVHWMVGQNLRQADLQLSPPELGPLEVRVVVTHDQANVSFTSNHAHVRDALEAAIPRLREMLEQQGLNLANADVSQHSFAEQRAARDDSNGSGSGAGGDGEMVDTPEDVAAPDGLRHGRGLVDYYA